jgi:predicted dehydrogenase
MARIAMLGSGFISAFYTEALHGYRSRDKVIIVQSRTEESGKRFCARYGVPKFTTSLEEAVNHPEVDMVMVGLPNNLHKEACIAAAKAGKAVMCTKPLARTGPEAYEILKAIEKAGVFHGYMEDLVYTPKTMKSIAAVKKGAIGRVLWARSRETHPGPHSDWFWNKEKSGGGAMLDLACHCIEISRSFIGKEHRPVEVMCWADTQVKPIEAEDHGIGLVKYDSGAIGQFEVSWTFRGGMDLRDEVMGSEGTIWLNNFLRTGFEMFTAPGNKGYVAEKAESESGWIFPVGDEAVELGYVNMFADQLNAFENKQKPVEDFYDGYVVNEILDACYRSAKSKKWEPVNLIEWRGGTFQKEAVKMQDYDADHSLIKEEKLPDGRRKVILKNKKTGEITQREV